MTDNKPLISIITVVYNGVKTINQAIESVISQTYPNIEYIIIDGGSTDGTLEVIEKYRDQISIVVSERDKGIYDAMNKGIKYATGDILAFLNSDDWYSDNAISTVVKHFKENEAEVFIGAANVVDGEEIVGIRKNELESICFSMPCCHQAVFARKVVFDKIGNFNTEYKICADYDWLLRGYYKRVTIQCEQDILVNYRNSGVSSVNKSKLRAEMEQIAIKAARQNGQLNLIAQIEKYYTEKKRIDYKDKMYDWVCNNHMELVQKIINTEVCYYIWGTGYYGKRCLKLFQTLNINIKGFVDNNKMQEVFWGVPVFLPTQIEPRTMICIATPKYENEIMNQLKKRGVDNKQYVCYSELRDKIVKIGEQIEKERQEVH